MSSQYLNMNNPKQFNVLCCAIGLDKAYMLARINGWAVFNESKENKEAFAGDCYWMFATQEQFSKEIFPFMPMRSLKRYLSDLTKEGLLISERHNRIKSSRLWYRVNQDAVNALCDAEKVKMTNSMISECQNGTIHEYPKCQNGTITNLNECQNGTKEAYTKCQNGTYEQQNSSLSAKVAPSECQNGTTIEIIKENINNCTSSLSGSLSLLESLIYKMSDAELAEHHDELMDLVKKLCTRETLLFAETEDSKALKKDIHQRLDKLKQKLYMTKPKEAPQSILFNYLNIENSAEEEAPNPSKAVSAGDLVAKYANMFS